MLGFIITHTNYHTKRIHATLLFEWLMMVAHFLKIGYNIILEVILRPAQCFILKKLRKVTCEGLVLFCLCFSLENLK